MLPSYILKPWIRAPGHFVLIIVGFFIEAFLTWLGHGGVKLMWRGTLDTKFARNFASLKRISRDGIGKFSVEWMNLEITWLV